MAPSALLRIGFLFALLLHPGVAVSGLPSRPSWPAPKPSATPQDAAVTSAPLFRREQRQPLDDASSASSLLSSAAADKSSDDASKEDTDSILATAASDEKLLDADIQKLTEQNALDKDKDVVDKHVFKDADADEQNALDKDKDVFDKHVFKDADADGNTEQSLLDKDKDVVDKQVFKDADADGNGQLDEGEMGKVMSGAGIPQDKFDWKSFDHDKDGQLSPDEFVAAGPAALHAKQAAAMKDADLSVFKRADEDGSGFLEEGEVEDVMHAAGVPHEKFDWKSFDHNKDDRLSETEFLEAGSAAASAVTPQPLSLLERIVVDRGGPAARLQIGKFDDYDINKSGALESAETKKLSGDAGFNTSLLDRDGDGVLSRDEFHQAADAEKADVNIFKNADVNKDSFLDQVEMGKLLHKIGLKTLDWRAFDDDKDGRLSLKEFLASGEAVAEASKLASLAQSSPSSSSLLEEGEEDDEEKYYYEDAEEDLDQLEDSDESEDGDEGEEDQDEEEDYGEEDSEAASLLEDEMEDEEVEEGELEEDEGGEFKDEGLSGDQIAAQVKHDFKEHDHNSDGLLDPSEIQELFDRIKLPKQSQDWEKHDANQDGKLSEGELLELATSMASGGRAASAVDHSDDEEEEEDEEVEKHEKEIIARGMGHEEEEDSFYDEEHQAPPRGPTDQQVKQAFNEADVDKSGHLEPHEMKSLVNKYAHSPDEVPWEHYDENADGKISEAELQTMAHENVGAHDLHLVDTGGADTAASAQSEKGGDDQMDADREMIKHEQQDAEREAREDDAKDDDSEHEQSAHEDKDETDHEEAMEKEDADISKEDKEESEASSHDPSKDLELPPLPDISELTAEPPVRNVLPHDDDTHEKHSATHAKTSGSQIPVLPHNGL